MHRTPRHLATALAAALLLLGAAACSDGSAGAAAGAPGDEVADARPGVRVVSPAAAADLLAADPAPAVIDVRTPEEFEQGHLEGAVLIDVTSPGFAERVAELDRDQPYVLYCRSGNRSVTARQVMAELGFADVADIGGGYNAWVAEERPVVTP